MSRLDALRSMTAADVIECLAEDPSVLGEWQKEITNALTALDDIRSAFLSHLDGHNYLDELNPAGWHHCDIVVRIGGKDRRFEGDWLKNVWYALRRSAGFVAPGASMSASMSDQAKNYAVDSAAKPNPGGEG